MNQEIEDLKKLVEFWQRKHAEAVAALWQTLPTGQTVSRLSDEKPNE